MSICLKRVLDSQPKEKLTAALNPSAEEFSSHAHANEGTTTLLVENHTTVLLPIAQAIVYNPAQPEFRVRVRVVLDTGSQKSYVTTGIQGNLNLVSKGKRSMSIATFGSARGSRRTCEIVELGVELCDGTSQLLRVFAVPVICEPIAGSRVNLSVDQFPHLRHLELSDPITCGESRGIDVLVGSDYYWNLVTGKILSGPSGPTALETRLGCGPATLIDGCEDPATLVTHTLAVNVPEQLDERLRSFWDVESLGNCDEVSSVTEEFDKNITFRDGRYEVPLPWKSFYTNLPDNYRLSHKRLIGLLRRLKQNPAILRVQ